MPDKPDVDVALATQDLLGEGPCWLEATEELLRVDILRGLIHHWHPASGRVTTAHVEGELGAAVPRASGGLVLAVDHDLVLDTPGEPRRAIASAEDRLSDNRFNDCRSDPRGRLWAGTMSRSRKAGTAGLYRLQPGRALELVVPDTTLSNGIGWSPAGDLMYFIDSVEQRIDVFDYDVETGEPSGRRPFASIEPQDGLPDGLAVDAEGGVWVCLFGGGSLRRYAPDGALDADVPMPVSHVTCPAFGGDDLATIFVTSTRHRLDAAGLEREPLAGSVFALDGGVRGLPAGLYAG